MYYTLTTEAHANSLCKEKQQKERDGRKRAIMAMLTISSVMEGDALSSILPIAYVRATSERRSAVIIVSQFLLGGFTESF